MNVLHGSCRNFVEVSNRASDADRGKPEMMKVCILDIIKREILVGTTPELER